ncbi:MAG: hypothetical protein KTR29_14675 [Rhodothermaceae bacterium]|nr:hypothetical protein [Rhodothermaceae bacterium]
MTSAVHTTLALLLLILVGMLLKLRIKKKEQMTGIKILVLSIALPAMIFVSLLKIQVDSSLLILPALALLFNLVLLGSSRFMLALTGLSPSSRQGRTFMMLLPSLAPGLSCFPFLMEYWGEEVLAWAALSDVGNKVFVLILLYLLAMHWYYAVQKDTADHGESRLKSLFFSLLREPVNLVIIVALIMLNSGLSFDSLPLFLQDSIMKMRSMMTPLILLYIGMAVSIKWSQFRLIGMLLCWRAGFSLIFSALLIALFSLSEPGVVILAVAFPLSAVSFWPFAHMTAIRAIEKRNGIEESNSTFDLDLGLGILACSLPLSTTLILIVSSSGTTFTSPRLLIMLGILLLVASFIPLVVHRIRIGATRREAETVV